MPKQPPRSRDTSVDGTPPAGGVSSDPANDMAGMEIGLSIVVAVLGLGALGFGLDKWLGTLPWLMLLGGSIGFVGWLVMVARRKRV